MEGCLESEKGENHCHRGSVVGPENVCIPAHNSVLLQFTEVLGSPLYYYPLLSYLQICCQI